MANTYRRLVVSERIKAEYGTLVNFSRKKGINLSTLKGVLYGRQDSEPILKLLKKEKFCLSANELGKEVA